MATKDFTEEAAEEVTFTLRGEKFEAWPEMPADALIDFAASIKNEPGTDVVVLGDRLRSAVKSFLKPDSASRFLERMGDFERPIKVEKANEIVEWLIEVYGLRPTQPSGPSSDGLSSPESGTNSTATTGPEASISELSPPPTS